MKKLSVIILTLVLISILSVCLFLSYNSEDESTTLEWNPENSYFLDYKIKNNRITFRYVIEFKNKSDTALSFQIGVKFSKKDTKGWLKNEFLIGDTDYTDENGYFPLDSNEKESIVFSFEGEYLGGNVNTNLSFPEEILPSVIFK